MGTKGQTKLSIQPTTVQISHIVSAIGAIHSASGVEKTPDGTA